MKRRKLNCGEQGRTDPRFRLRLFVILASLIAVPLKVENHVVTLMAHTNECNWGRMKMKFYIEIAKSVRVMDVQRIGVMDDGRFVVEAATPKKAKAKVFRLLSEILDRAQARPATHDEAEEFTKAQAETAEALESVKKHVARFIEGTS